jgi:hypothetical protein
LPRARTLALTLDQDAELLEAAAVLHDVGHAPESAGTGFHPLDGARYLRADTDADKRVTNLVAHHSCAWTEAEARGPRQELESEFARESEHLNDALCYCDMNTTPGRHAHQSHRPDQRDRRPVRGRQRFFTRAALVALPSPLGPDH